MGNKKVVGVILLTISIIIYLNFTGNGLAEENNPPKSPHSPFETLYIIKKGDTLWDISGEFLKNPFLWPNIWDKNGYIKNPDLIYPENKLIIPLIIQSIPAGKEGVIAPEVTSIPAPAPVPESPVTASIPTLPPSPPQPHGISGEPILKPLVVPVISVDMINAGGYIVNKVESYGIIRGSSEGRNIFADGDTVNISLLKDYADNVSLGDKLTIFRTSGPVTHPRTGKKAGILFIPVGVLEINRVQGLDAGGKIIKSYSYSSPGDLIQPYYPAAPFVETTQVPPGLHGFIVASQEGMVLNAQYGIVYLDRGAADGVFPGTIFYVVREKKDNVIGELKVISVQELTSTALVLKSIEPFSVGSKIVTTIK